MFVGQESLGSPLSRPVLITVRRLVGSDSNSESQRVGSLPRLAGHLGDLLYLRQDRACVLSVIHLRFPKAVRRCRRDASVYPEQTGIVSEECQRVPANNSTRHLQRHYNEWILVYCSQSRSGWPRHRDCLHPTNLGLRLCHLYSEREDEFSKSIGNRSRLSWNRHCISSGSPNFTSLLWRRSLTHPFVSFLGNWCDTIQSKSKN